MTSRKRVLALLLALAVTFSGGTLSAFAQVPTAQPADSGFVGKQRTIYWTAAIE